MQGCISGASLTTFCIKSLPIQVYSYNSVIKLIIAIHLQISNKPMPNMWYIIQQHTIVTIASIIIPCSSKPSHSITQLLRCWCESEFLTIQETQQFESISTSWEFIPNTNPGRPDHQSPQVTFGTTQVHISRVRTAPHNRGHQMLGRLGLAYPWAQFGSLQGAHNKTGLA